MRAISGREDDVEEMSSLLELVLNNSSVQPGPTPDNSLCDGAAGYSPHVVSGNVEVPDSVSEDIALEKKIGDRMQKFLKALPSAHVDTKDIQVLDWCDLVDDDVFDEAVESLENMLVERLDQARKAFDNTLADGCGTKVIGGQSSEEERRAKLRSGASNGQVSASGCEDNYPGPVAGPLAACEQPNRLITLFGKATYREKSTDKTDQSVGKEDSTDDSG